MRITLKALPSASANGSIGYHNTTEPRKCIREYAEASDMKEESMQPVVSRSAFVKGASAGLLGVAGASMLTRRAVADEGASRPQ